MDKLTIFPSATKEVTLKTEENNTIDTVVDGLGGITEELKKTRKGNEAFVYGQPVEGNDEVDLEGINEEDENG